MNIIKPYLVALMAAGAVVVAMARPAPCMRAVSYNVENFFDTNDDPLTDDDEFTPNGARKWTASRYNDKAVHIAKTIMAIGEGKAPFLVALCEVENDHVLRKLACNSPLRTAGYCYVHYDSPDPRGIDVALLYQDSIFHLEQSESVAVQYSSGGRGRDILYAAGRLPGGELLHVFVCHLPSRINGDKAADKRCQALRVLNNRVSRLLDWNPNALIIVMGDFNDNPTDVSMKTCLQATSPETQTKSSRLYNLAMLYTGRVKSEKHQGEWAMLDQIIVSGSLLQADSPVKVGRFKVFDQPFLLENDSQWSGQCPYRTYKGMKYIDGYSDHLPVYVDFSW
ncbi:MAG: endonuclease [Paludibacteraceae bacterium]|nr:endonuclease [Paludibacteraceae bacterium]